MNEPHKLNYKTLPLSMPLTASLAGTLLPLLTKNTALHKYSGLIFTGLSLWHMWQHHEKMQKDFEKGRESMGLLDFLDIPTTKLDAFIRSVEISSYLPGRIRLYSKKIINNPKQEEEVLRYLKKYPELNEVTVNIVTGSILIQYTPETLRANPELKKVEDYIQKKAKIKH